LSGIGEIDEEATERERERQKTEIQRGRQQRSLSRARSRSVERLEQSEGNVLFRRLVSPGPSQPMEYADLGASSSSTQPKEFAQISLPLHRDSPAGGDYFNLSPLSTDEITASNYYARDLDFKRLVDELDNTKKTEKDIGLWPSTREKYLKYLTEIGIPSGDKFLPVKFRDESKSKTNHNINTQMMVYVALKNGLPVDKSSTSTFFKYWMDYAIGEPKKMPAETSIYLNIYDSISAQGPDAPITKLVINFNKELRGNERSYIKSGLIQHPNWKVPPEVFKSDGTPKNVYDNGMMMVACAVVKDYNVGQKGTNGRDLINWFMKSFEENKKKKKSKA
jgi:hypothetical protein